MRLAGLWRYPLKGLGGQELQTAQLGFHAALPGDRAYAPVRRGPPPVMLRKPAIATLEARLEASRDGEGDHLALWRRGVVLASADPLSQTGRIVLAEALADALGILDPLEIAPTGSFRGGYQGPATVSLMAASSITALSDLMGLPALDARRFRSNLIIDGLEANTELGWRGQRLRLGEAELRITGPIRRCRVIDTSLDTGERDLPLLAKLAENGSVPLLGVYAEVVRPGRISAGDVCALADQADK
jgi:uncharacterized protein